MRWCILVFAIICFLLQGIEAKAEKRVALVIGNGGYTATPPLKNPSHDAPAIAETLRMARFSVIEHHDLNLLGFAGALEEFSAALDGADVALFYYAGHGMQAEGENLLLPVDATLESAFLVRAETIPLASVLQVMESKARISLVFLDACRDNPLAEALGASDGSVSRSAGAPRGLARISGNQSNILIAFATKPGDVAADGDGVNSPFTAALVREIPEPGSEISVMMKRVARWVSDSTGGRQRPEQITDMTEEFYFHGGPDEHDIPDVGVCRVSIDMPKSTYRIGELLDFTVTPTCPCDLGLVDYKDAEGLPEVILPGSDTHFYLTAGNKLTPSVPFHIPFAETVFNPKTGKRVAVKITITEPLGINRIGAFCTVDAAAAVQPSSTDLQESITLNGFHVAVEEITEESAVPANVFTTTKSYIVEQ